LEESLAKPSLDGNKIIYLASSTKKNLNLGKYPEKRLH